MRKPRVTAARPRSSTSAALRDLGHRGRRCLRQPGGELRCRDGPRLVAAGARQTRDREQERDGGREPAVGPSAVGVDRRIVEQLGSPRVQDPDAIEIERRMIARLLRGQLVGEVRQPPPHLRPRPGRPARLRDRYAGDTFVDVPGFLRRPAAGEPPQARRPRQRDPRRGDGRRADWQVADPHRSPQPLVEARPPLRPALDCPVERRRTIRDGRLRARRRAAEPGRSPAVCFRSRPAARPRECRWPGRGGRHSRSVVEPRRRASPG